MCELPDSQALRDERANHELPNRSPSKVTC
jgi:hypothetical protein